MSSPPLYRISISTGTILRTIAILVALVVLWLIRDIVLYVFIAILVAGLLYPFARWARTHKIPRGLAVVLAYVGLFGIMGLAFALIIPAVLDEIRSLAGVHGGSWQAMADAASFVRDAALRFGFSGSLQTSLQGLQGQLQDTLGNLFSVVTNLFGGIVGFFIVLVLSFYIIVEDSAIKDMFRNVVPPDYQILFSHVAWQVIDKLGSWLRGQLVLGLILGILYFIGFSIIQVPYALLLAILGGLLEFIPYIGPILAAIPAVFFAMTDSPIKALIVLVLIIVIQQLENNVIVPKVMQKAVGLNPIVSIIAFLIGASLFGVVGALFAIPIATAASVTLGEYLKFRRERVK